jgi:AraC-like DNA-binding protein
MFAALKPRGPLSSVVEMIWIARASGEAAGLESRLPTGRPEVTVNLDGDEFALPGEDGARQRYPAALVTGPSVRPFLLDAAQMRHVLGIVFRPAAARGLLGVPMREIAGLHIPLSDLWGRAATELRERVLTITGVDRRLSEVERILGARLVAERRATHPVARAAVSALSSPHRREPGRLEEALGLSRRRIEQLFEAEVGLAPDACRRLARFRAALENVDRAAQMGWARFALELGYCDQSHLIRAFQAHAGVSPELYLRRRGTELNHLPVRDLVISLPSKT